MASSMTPNPNLHTDDELGNAFRSPKSSVAAIPSNADPDDPEEISPFSSSSPAWTPSMNRRPPKRKKMERRRAALEKTWQKNLETLSKSLKPVPFVPCNMIDFAPRENFLRRVGLWDFVHLQFDTYLRVDLIGQLIANFSKESRVSYVNGARIQVSRADLGRALRLPKREKGNMGQNTKESDDDIGFLEKLVSTWLLLHGDMWMMPDEVLNWTTMIKEGNIERVDWAGLIWFMVEKELLAKSVLEHCYYASHLQCLIKHQKEELLEERSLMSTIDVDEDEGVIVSEDAQSIDEGCVDLSLGDTSKLVSSDHPEEIEVESKVMKCADGDAVSRKADTGAENTFCEGDMQDIGTEQGNATCCYKDDVSTLNMVNDDEEKILIDSNGRKDEEKKDVLFEGNDKDFNEVEEDGKNDLLIGSSILQCSLGRCSQVIADCLNSEEEKIQQRLIGNDQMQEVVVAAEVGMEIAEEDDDEEDIMEEEDNEEIEGNNDGIGIFSQRTAFDDAGSEDLLSPMGAVVGSFRPGLHMPDTSAPGHFLISGVESHRMPNNSFHYSTSNENKRAFEHSQSDFHQYSLAGGNKKLKSEGVGWDNKPSSEIDIWMDQMHQLMGKYKGMYDSKEHACQEMIMNQQLYLSELQQRDAVIQRQKDELQRKHLEVYSLENELCMMGSLVEGYRKALTGTQKSFSAYRAKYQIAKEPIYTDTGSGGLVLSKMELEKQRLRREEDERQTLMCLVTKAKEFETAIVGSFECFEDRIELLRTKLTQLEEKGKLLKEGFSRGLTLPVVNPTANLNCED